MLAVTQTPIPSSPSEALRIAPKACIAGAVGLACVWLLFGLSWAPLVLAPITGLISFGFLVAYWRLEKEFLAVTHSILLVVPALVVPGASGQLALGSTLQYLATSALFMYLPLLLLGKKIAGWASRAHS